MTLFQGAAATERLRRKVPGTSFTQATQTDVREESAAWLGPAGDCGEQEKGPRADVHQTKWEMRGSKIFAVSVCFFTGEFVLLLLKEAKKTTMNISGQEINKSRINIDAPEGACDLFFGCVFFFF